MGALYTIYIETGDKLQMLDITGEIQRLAADSQTVSGICTVFVPHTTAGLLISENRDPYLAGDFFRAFGQLAGEAGNYRSLENNFPAYLLAGLVGTSTAIPVENGRLALGAWQSIYLMEFDGGRKRKVRVKFMEDR